MEVRNVYFAKQTSNIFNETIFFFLHSFMLVFNLGILNIHSKCNKMLKSRSIQQLGQT